MGEKNGQVITAAQKSFITQAQVLISLASSTSLAIQTIDAGSDTGHIALILGLMQMKQIFKR
jgi:hypothetical protein